MQVTPDETSIYSIIAASPDGTMCQAVFVNVK